MLRIFYEIPTCVGMTTTDFYWIATSDEALLAMTASPFFSYLNQTIYFTHNIQHTIGYITIIHDFINAIPFL